jgi:hypothetical protein
MLWLLSSTNGGLSLHGDEHFAWYYLTCSSNIGKQGGSSEEVHSSQGENARSDLNWLCLTMTLLRTLFLRGWSCSKVKIQGLTLVGYVWQ